jgi:uncharacterized protein (TIGR03435 family)
VGPTWLDHNEYDVEARLPDDATREQVPLMLRALLSDRFHLRVHSETRPTRVYELTVAAGGPRVHPIQASEAATAGSGLHFHGDMRQFAELLAVQISMPAPTSASVPVIASESPTPVLDKTGLERASMISASTSSPKSVPMGSRFGSECSKINWD